MSLLQGWMGYQHPCTNYSPIDSGNREGMHDSRSKRCGVCLRRFGSGSQPRPRPCPTRKGLYMIWWGGEMGGCGITWMGRWMGGLWDDWWGWVGDPTWGAGGC